MQSVLNFFNSKPGKILRHLVSATLVVGFALQVDRHRLSAVSGSFRVWPLIWALMLAGLAYALHAPRWWLLLRAQGLLLSLGWAQRVTWIGTFYNSFLLGGLGGDAARVFYVCRDAPTQRPGGIAATLLDRALGLVVLLCIAAAALVVEAGTLTQQPDLRRALIIAVTCFFGLGIAVGQLLWRRAPLRWPAWLRRVLGQKSTVLLTDLLGRVKGSVRPHAYALGLSFAIWALDFVSIWLVAKGAGLDLPFLKTCIAASVGYAATALPISVGGHGVREGSMLVTLQFFGLIPNGGMGQDRALLLALGIWAITVVWSLVGGVVLLSSSPDHKARPSPAPSSSQI